MPLFRSESEEARATAWLGRIVLLRPLTFTFLTVSALVMAVVLAAFFVVGEYTRKARLTGVLAPRSGVVRVMAQQPGVVEVLDAHEGMSVEADDVLLVVADPRTSSMHEALGDSMAARLDERRRALESQQAHALAALHMERAALEQRRAGLGRELAQLDTEIEMQSRRVGLARVNATRSMALQATGFVSAAAADRDRDAALDQEVRFEGTRRTRLALSRELGAIETEIAAARARGEAQLAAMDAQRAALDQERLERDVQHRQGVTTPVSGTVATVLVEAGQMVPAGATMATILPRDARLEAHLFAPSRSIGFLRPGQQVLLRYLAYPHQKFGSHTATVIGIARNPLAPADLGFTPPDGSRELLYRIKVELDSQAVSAYGRLEPLRPGMQVEADILLDKRRLIEWVFEPILSLAGRA